MCLWPCQVCSSSQMGMLNLPITCSWYLTRKGQGSTCSYPGGGGSCNLDCCPHALCQDDLLTTLCPMICCKGVGGGIFSLVCLNLEVVVAMLWPKNLMSLEFGCNSLRGIRRWRCTIVTGFRLWTILFFYPVERVLPLLTRL